MRPQTLAGPSYPTFPYNLWVLKSRRYSHDRCRNLIGEAREVWAGFVKRQLSSSVQWLDPGFHSVYVKLPFACKVCLILGIWAQLFCLKITFNKSCAFSIHQNTPGGMGHGPGGMGRCHVSYSFFDNENNTRSWYLP